MFAYFGSTYPHRHSDREHELNGVIEDAWRSVDALTSEPGGGVTTTARS